MSISMSGEQNPMFKISTGKCCVFTISILRLIRTLTWNLLDKNCLGTPTDAASHNARSINSARCEFFSFYLTTHIPLKKPYRSAERCQQREPSHLRSEERPTVPRTSSLATWKRPQNGLSFSSTAGLGCHTIIYCEKTSILSDAHRFIFQPRSFICSSYKLLYEEAAYFFFSACKENIGFTHATVSSVPVVLYDQIGGGASSHRPDAPTEFWVPELFMDELDNLIEALGIHDNFDLLGHSWGGVWLSDYTLNCYQ